MWKYNTKILIALCVLLTLTACNNEVTEDETLVAIDTSTMTNTESDNTDYSDWTEETHSKEWELDYDTVFPQNEVNRIDIVISPEQWELMNEDMEGLYWEFWANAGWAWGVQWWGQRQRPTDGERPVDWEFPAQWERPVDWELPPEGELPADGEWFERPAWWGWPEALETETTTTEKPIYVESQVFFNGTQWYNVWVKYKGHSSLQSSWRSWNYKLPLKLKFDEFEDDYEELDDQRFFGFKKISFSSNYLDDSLLHEKLASEAFDEAGIISPETAFYSIYVDYGEGAEYFGMYTAVENVDDTLIEQFWDDSGNVYEAEWEWVTLEENTFDQISTHYEKKTNEDESDWSDIENLSQILNSDLRTTDVEAWKDELEAVFDVPVFLNWLAVNGTIQNWDTYWVMTHNFYLYNNPETGKLTWIPWDNNESFSEWKRGLVTLTANSTGEDWPLIRYLLDVEEYRAEYVENVNDFAENVLGTDAFADRVEELHNMIEPYVIGENGEQADATHLRDESSFTSSLATLQTFIAGRVQAALSLSLDDDFEYNPSAVQTNVWWGQRGQRPGWAVGIPQGIPNQNNEEEEIN